MFHYRLGIIPVEDTTKLNKNVSENGDENLSSSSDTENGRVLRKKKNLRVHSALEDNELLLSPKKSRRESESGVNMDGSGITSNGQYTSSEQ